MKAARIFNRDGFDRFWATYPRRVGRLAAIKAWNVLKPDADLVRQMLKTIRWQVDTDQWQRGFVPHPRTWLSQGRWDDEPEQAPGQTAKAQKWTCPHTPQCPHYVACEVVSIREAR